MSAYSDSVSEPIFSEPDPVSAKKNIETEVEIGFFRPFPSVFIANWYDKTKTSELRVFMIQFLFIFQHPSYFHFHLYPRDVGNKYKGHIK
jgi:hypothetical protein